MEIIAITACPTGIAHTYMAATRLEVIAKQMGHTIKVEKQGAKGIENELTPDDIHHADIIIFAVSTKVKNEERFEGKSIYRCSVTDPIKNGEQVILDAIEKNIKKEKLSEVILKHILTGESYMLPVVLGASLMMAIACTIASLLGVEEIWSQLYAHGGILGFLHILYQLGELALGLMLPVFAGFIAYSIADKPGLASGFVGGLLAKTLGSGFFGALSAGIIAGYLSKYLSHHLTFEGAASGLGDMLSPLISISLIALLVYYIVGPVFYEINHLIIMFFNESGYISLMMAFLVGGLMAYDLGGPVNKITLLISIGLLESHVYVLNTAAMIAIVVPSIGYGLATYLLPQIFSTEFKEKGKESIVLGLVGESEGAIPFTQVCPKVMKCINMLGCAIGALTAVYLGAMNITTVSGCYGWLFVKNWPVYLLGIFVGCAVIVIGVLLNKKWFKGE